MLLRVCIVNKIYQYSINYTVDLKKIFQKTVIFFCTIIRALTIVFIKINNKRRSRKNV